MDTDPTLLEDLDVLVEPTTRGDPESPLRWTCKSMRQLARELNRMGHRTSHRMVAELLHGLDYSLQGNRKTLEGASHPDRNAQFEYINRKAKEYMRSKDPVLSVDTKKKELVGNFKNGAPRKPAAPSTANLRGHDDSARHRHGRDCAEGPVTENRDPSA